MAYHAKNISEDGVLCMLAYGFALKNIEEKWPIFKDEPRNVRLSSATVVSIHLASFVLLT